MTFHKQIEKVEKERLEALLKNVQESLEREDYEFKRVPGSISRQLGSDMSPINQIALYCEKEDAKYLITLEIINLS